jgi:hypothetical protein
MKKIFIIISSIICLHQVTLNAQKIEWGISPSCNISSFDYKDDAQFNASIFSPVNSYNPGVMAFVGFNTSSAFQVRLLAHLNFKRLKYNILLNGAVDGYLAYDFMGYDLGLLSRYSIDVKKWKIAPGLGFFLSYNDSQGWVYKTNSTTTIAGIDPMSLDDYDTQLPLSVGALGSLEIVPPFSLNGRTMSFQVSGWYALKDFIDEPIKLISNSETTSVTGKYNQLSLSLNFYFK